MHTLLVANRDITYDGRQLASHWIYRNFDLMGDAAVAFLGPCHVDLSEMVDIEDVKAQAPIFTTSPTSTLIHTGLNIETEGTPVPTVGLAELGVDPAAFGAKLLRHYADEINDIWLARCKVRAVG